MSNNIDKATLVEWMNSNMVNCKNSIAIHGTQDYIRYELLLTKINSGEFDCKDDDIPKSIIDKLDRAKQCAINADKNELISLFGDVIEDLLNHIDNNYQKSLTNAKNRVY